MSSCLTSMIAVTSGLACHPCAYGSRQLRENLAELPQDESALPKLDAMKAEAKSRIEERESRFSEAFSADQLPQAKKIFHELQFIYKLLDETLQAEEQRLGY